MINLENLSKYVQWLRSATDNGITQGFGYLYRFTDSGQIEVDALGGAVISAMNSGVHVKLGFDPYLAGSVTFDGWSECLPPVVRDFYGFESKSPWIKITPNFDYIGGSGLIEISDLNDNYRLSFHQIANMIEFTYPGILTQVA